MKKLWVSEIFQSVQGEGFNTGKLAIFIRFSGCSLECDFCDTKYAWDKYNGKEFTPESLVSEIRLNREWKSRFIILTGGEPLEQDFNSLKELVYLFHSHKYVVALETNGLIKFKREYLNVDWITVSPKTGLFLDSGDELKILFRPIGVDHVSQYEHLDFKHFYVQPVLPNVTLNADNMKQFRNLFSACLTFIKKNPKWKLSSQLHKLIGVR